MIALVAVLTGCDYDGGDRAAPASPGSRPWSISVGRPDTERAQARAGGRLYYLGDSFEGLPLVHAEGSNGRALFVYGTCKLPAGQTDGGCSPPLQLQEEATPVEGPLGCAPTPGEPRLYENDPSATIVFAGTTMIKIYANDRELGRRAARALEPVVESC